MESIEEHLLCQKMLDKYDVSLQPLFIRAVLSHAIYKEKLGVVIER